MSKDSPPAGQLWVCWQKPEPSPPADAPVLSFLSPAAEDEFERQHPGVVIRGREASSAIRPKARETYLDLVARIGIAPYRNGSTFRQALARRGGASEWWYHHVSFKSAEVHPTFQWIIEALTIRAVAEDRGLKRLVLVGAPWQLAAALKSAFAVEERGAAAPENQFWIWLKSLAARAKHAVMILQQWMAAWRRAALPAGVFDVAFSSFWDSGVWWDGRAKSLADRNFGSLPAELKRRGISKLGWFAWFDPHSEPGREGRDAKDVLAPTAHAGNIVLLQSLLRPWDIVKAMADVRPLLVFVRIRRQADFHRAFEKDGMCFYSLFSEWLLRGFLNASLPYHRLVAVATERACRRYRPRFTVSFLEHFLYSRAHYEGARRSGIGTICCAVQHASYNHEKTFVSLHPSLEFGGSPDGCPTPHPDYVFAMGALGRELFLECGYPQERVLLTGSSRYDHIRFPPPQSPPPMRPNGPSRKIRVLMVSTLNLDLEMDMLEAVCTAARNIPGIRLLFRNHPLSSIESHRRFNPYKTQVTITRGSLADDLDQAELVVFTYSTVAEEAFILGRPVWQWLPIGFNGSALAEVVSIPQFGSIAALRQALLEFQTDPARFFPEAETRLLVLQRLFFSGDGGAARRIAAAVSNLSPTFSAEDPMAGGLAVRLNESSQVVQ